MTFQESIFVCFRKFATFEGRAARPEFWYFTLFCVIVFVLTGIADAAIFPNHALGVLSLVAYLLLLLPALAVGARRLHDVGRSGWWQLLWLTVIGGVIPTVWQCQPGTPGQNPFNQPEAQNLRVG